MSMAALIPSLAFKVEGNYDENHKLAAASSVSFKGNDLEQAESIQAGLNETTVQNQQQQAKLEQQNEALKAHNEELQKQ